MCERSTWRLTINEHENLHFDNEWDIYMSSNFQNYEANGYDLNLDLLII